LTIAEKLGGLKGRKSRVHRRRRMQRLQLVVFGAAKNRLELWAPRQNDRRRWLSSCIAPPATFT